jgi:hypothetical protein
MVAVASLTPAHVVSHDEDDIGLLSALEGGAEEAENGQEEAHGNQEGWGEAGER